MDTPLITAEGSGGSSSAPGSSRFSRGSLIHRRKPPQSRSDAITQGTQYQKAAALVDLAEDGIGLPEEVLDDHRFETAAKYYFMYIKFDILWSLNLLALLLLNFFEKPLWCVESDGNPCQNREYFFLGQLPYLTNVESLIYEGITLIILTIHTFFPISYEGSHLYWKNYLNIAKVIFLMLLAVDLLVYILFMTPVPFSFLPLRVAPYIRIFFIALNIRELRSCIVTLAGMMGMYVNILALWLLFLLFSSWLAYVTFEDTIQGKEVFSSFGTTLYQMFVLFTTSNNPDVWIPAYKNSRWSCLFFVLYILLGVYFLTNLILAVVYDSFKVQLARQVADMDSARTRILKKAFSIIDTHNHGFLNKDECVFLFEELNKYRSLPKTSHDDFELIFRELDDSGDFKINMDEFADLCNAIALKFQKEPSPSWFEYYPSFYHSAPCKSFKAFVRSATFGYIVAFVLVLNLIAVIVETTLDIQNSSAQKFWQKIEFFFGWIYVLEMALKIFSMGFSKYWMEGQNQFDFVVTLIIVIGETATFCFPEGLPFLSNGEWIRYLLIARMLRLIRLLTHVQRYRAFLATFFTLIPSLMPYLGTIFCVMCLYCTLGLQIFGGIVNAGNPKLEATDLSDNEYPFFGLRHLLSGPRWHFFPLILKFVQIASWVLSNFQHDYIFCGLFVSILWNFACLNGDSYLLFNFNDYPNGMVTLFNLLVMGNWQAWMQSYKVLTGTYWSLTYFISFYLIAVVLLLNLVLAFVLEAFFAEMEMENDASDNNKVKENDASDGDKDESETEQQRRRIGIKSRSRIVDNLLHRILSNELSESQS